MLCRRCEVCLRLQSSFSWCVPARGTGVALSTLYGVVDAVGLAFVGENGRRVVSLDGAQGRIRVLRIGLIPIEAGEVVAKHLLLENHAVTRVYLVAQLSRILAKHSLKKTQRQRFGGQRV